MTERPRIRTIETPEQQARRLELNRRQEIRSNFLVPLYVMWTSDVLQPEARAALQGVIDVVRASGQDRQVINLSSRQWSEGAFSSADWYLQEAIRRQSEERNRGHGEQIDTLNLSNLFYEEPWQESPHWEVFIVNKDLYAYGTNFVFGVTDPSFPASVQSVRRLVDSVADQNLRIAMVRRLLRHEVGHMFGLPSRNRTRNIEQSLGSHCTEICTMRQGLSIPVWANHTIEEERLKIHFCSDCMTELVASKDRFKPLS